MDTYKVIYQRIVQTIKSEYDDDENLRTINEVNRTLEFEDFEETKMKDAFAKEDGDGDDCGSWSLQIAFITTKDNQVIYDRSTKHAEIQKQTLISFGEYLAQEQENAK
jgi:hypothetical protein